MHTDRPLQGTLRRPGCPPWAEITPVEPDPVSTGEGRESVDVETASWGIEPVPDRLRVLGFLDTLLLWGNLSISLLVIVLGAFLVPALSLPTAKLSDSVFGFSARWVWAVAFGAISVALGLLGPIGFVRRYVKKFAAWAVLASIVYLTWWVLDKSHLHAFWSAKAGGGMTFGQGADLVIGSIVSWM